MYNYTGAGDGQVFQSYEDFCRHHIDNYLTSAEAFAVETALTRRVSEWKDKLEPILSRQEEAKPFDIHAYGEDMLTRFPRQTGCLIDL